MFCLCKWYSASPKWLCLLDSRCTRLLFIILVISADCDCFVLAGVTASYFTRFLLLVSWEHCSVWYFVVHSIFSCFSWFVIDRTDTKWHKSKTPCTLTSIIISEWLSKQTNNAWSVFIILLNNILFKCTVLIRNKTFQNSEQRFTSSN